MDNPFKEDGKWYWIDEDGERSKAYNSLEEAQLDLDEAEERGRNDKR